MENIKVWMYPDEASANSAMVDFIKHNKITGTESIDFYNDPYVLDFEFFNMEDPGNWYGTLPGVMLTDISGRKVIFASWFSPFYDMKFEDYLAKVVKAVTLFEPNEEFR